MEDGRDVEVGIVVRDPDLRHLGGLVSFVRLGLHEPGDREGCLPHGIVEAPVQSGRDRGGRGVDRDPIFLADLRGQRPGRPLGLDLPRGGREKRHGHGDGRYRASCPPGPPTCISSHPAAPEWGYRPSHARIERDTRSAASCWTKCPARGTVTRVRSASIQSQVPESADDSRN